MKTTNTKFENGRCSGRCAFGLGLLLGLSLVAPARGGWTKLANTAPGSVTLLLLLSDGTVMAAHNPSGINGGDIGREWYLLTPDIHGSYVNGTWSSLASMHNSRLWYSSAILKDGRIFVAGGEYGDGGSTAEVYDPQLNSWTLTPSAGVGFSDSDSKILPDGKMLVSPVS
jgi:hypothetical protein